MDLHKIKAYCKDPKNRSTVNVGLFILLIISFHFIYLGWQAIGYWPIGKTIEKLMLWSVNLVYSQSCWLLEHVFRIDITTISHMRSIATPNNDGGFPGPWKHKRWYIPAGLVIIEWTNAIRICGILMMQIPWPNSFHLAHDYIFKVFFYLVIFLMWVLWVEKFYNPSIKAKQHE